MAATSAPEADSDSTTASPAPYSLCTQKGQFKLTRTPLPPFRPFRIFDLPFELRERIFQELAYRQNDVIPALSAAHIKRIRAKGSKWDYVVPIDTLVLSRQWYRELSDVFYGCSPFLFYAEEVLVEEGIQQHGFIFDTSDDLNDICYYGYHTKKWTLDDSGDEDAYKNDGFRIVLPKLFIRERIKYLHLALTPPGGDEKGLHHDGIHSWRDVEYHHPDSDWLWPLRNLPALGFTNLRQLNIIFKGKTFPRPEPDFTKQRPKTGFCWEVRETDRGFKEMVTNEVAKIGYEKLAMNKNVSLDWDMWPFDDPISAKPLIHGARHGPHW